jgi:hypothetical protein
MLLLLQVITFFNNTKQNVIIAARHVPWTGADLVHKLQAAGRQLDT